MSNQLLELLQIPAEGLISKSALPAIRDHFLELTYATIDEDQVVFTVNTATSTLDLVGREEATDGSPGKFVGSFSVPYQKVPIERCLPFPLFLDIDYPTNFSMIRSHLLERYGVVLEQFELSKTPSGPGLGDSDFVDAQADAANMVELYVSDASGRFITGDPVRFSFARVGGARSLNLTFRQVGRPETASLMENQNPQGAATVFDSTDQEFVLELLKNHFGIEMPSDSCRITVKPLNYNTSVAFIRPNDGSSLWRGTAEFQFDKSPISEALPDTIVVNTDYPITFSALQSYLKNTYGMRVADGEFSLTHPKQPPLRFGDVVNAPLDDQGFLTLYVTRNSVRWRGRDRITLQFLKSVADLNQNAFAGNPPTTADVGSSYNYSYPGAITNPGTVYSVVRGTPPAPLSSAGVYSGTVSTAGTYLWTVLSKTAAGTLSLQTEQAVIT